MKIAKAVLAVWMVSVSPVLPARAQEGARPGTGAGPEVSMDAAGLVSLDFREANIRNVLQVLALKSGINIVSSPEVTGTVSIQLNEVPWKQALEIILQTYGYAHEQQGNIIVVTTVPDMKLRRENAMLLAEQEPLSTDIFTLNFARAEEVISSVEKMISPRGAIDFDARTNTLIVTETARQIEKIAMVIKRLDRTTPQVMIEAKIIKTTLDDNENLGVDWATALSATGAARPTSFPFRGKNTNTFVSDQFPDLVDVSDGSTTELAESVFTYGTLDATGVSAMLGLLSARNDTKILSNPRIVTLDNRKARIVVGEQFPIPSYAYSEKTNRLQITGFLYKDIGIVFNVTPQVNNAGFITLSVQPEVSALKGSVSSVDGTTLPLLTNETAETNVMIRDGETLIIAGLIQDEVEEINKKVPFFGDIPFLGKAFQHKSRTENKTDLIIFITPTIVTPELLADGS
jgi:type IV pilus assembly protein PilQ